jgi:hypothetical protein
LVFEKDSPATILTQASSTAFGDITPTRVGATLRVPIYPDTHAKVNMPAPKKTGILGFSKLGISSFEAVSGYSCLANLKN